MLVEIDDQVVATLHTYSTVACLAKAALVAVLHTEGAVIPCGTASLWSLYASVMQSLRDLLMADLDILFPKFGREIEINKASDFLMCSVL